MSPSNRRSAKRRAKALLLAAGLGTRLRPLTETLPKCMVPIAGKPLIGYWFDLLEAAGIHDVLINTHYLPDPFRAYMKDVMAKRPLRLHEAHEPKLLGSAGTVAQNRAWADDCDEIVLVYADNLSNVNLTRLLDFHRGHSDPITMMLFHTAYPSQCGIAALDAAGHIVEFVEKPKEPKSDQANAGLYVLEADAYRDIADRHVFDIGFDILPSYIGKMSGFVFDGYHRDIGNLDALAAAEADAPRVFGAKA